MKRLRISFGKSLIFALGTLVAGCEGGGLGCPGGTPDCCYDSLFGCGAFELPFGCSCEGYGLFTQPLVTKIAAAKAPASSGLSGTWVGTLSRKASTCPAVLNEVRGGLRITEKRNGKVSVTVPGYGTLNGKRGRSGYTLSGKYPPALSACSARINGTIKKTRAKKADMRADLRYSCGSFTCTARYRGIFTKEG